MIVNGKKQQYIEIADRAFQYGDGCFTTMAFRNNQLELFDAHMERLKFACKTLYIDFCHWQELQDCIFDSLIANADTVVKVIITRGEGGRGYSPVGVLHPNFVITHHPIPSDYILWRSKGITVTVSPVALACQPLLAGIKHLNRLEQVLVKQALSQTHYNDAVVCDTQQNIIESSVGNLFWYVDNVWHTADLLDSGVEGVMRNLILTVLQQKGLECRVVKHDISVLLSAQELFVCNSLMLLVPVQSLFNPITQQNTVYNLHQTRLLQHDVQSVINLKVNNS